MLLVKLQSIVHSDLVLMEIFSPVSLVVLLVFRVVVRNSIRKSYFTKIALEETQPEIISKVEYVENPT